MSAFEAYHDALRRHWIAAGRPSLRAVARNSGSIVSYGAVGDHLNGRTIGTWPTARAVLVGLGLDEPSVERMRELYAEAEAEEDKPIFARQILAELKQVRSLLEKLVEDKA